MKSSRAKLFAGFFICLATTFAAISLASLIQTDFGNVDVSAVAIDTGYGAITGKLYRPKIATNDHPAPAVLLMHGYQNDKETSAAFSIELARRGIVALSIDLFGHGNTEPGMRERGYTQYKYPDFEKKISGPERYKVMMNFSNMDFFDPSISTGIRDSSMGGKDAYAFLKTLDFVDSKAMGITGHSMGTWAAWSVAAAFPDHKAVVLQCGELFPETYYDSESLRFNNVLLLQAKYDEFAFFRDYEKTVDGLEKTELRYKDFAGQDGPIQWNTTYGAFADGSARRMELLNINHRLTTHYGRALTTAMDWFVAALGAEPSIKASNHMYLIKELSVMIAMLAALASMLPLLALLVRIPFFAETAQAVSGRVETRLIGKAWWKTALVAVLVSGATFPFLTQLGHGLMPFPENLFRMTIGNGFVTWLTFLMIVAFLLLVRWYKKDSGRVTGVSLYDLGLACESRQNSISWSVIGKSVLLAFILCFVVYVQVAISGALFLLDFRFIWPFFRAFTPERFTQFWVYLPFYLAFFFVNGGVKLFGQLRQTECDSPVRTQIHWWLKACVVMLGGLFLSVLIEYIPFFLGLGPGADLLFSPTFGGPFMSILLLTIPQFAVMFFLSTWIFRTTGYVYTGSVVMGILATWMLASGSAMF